MALASVFIRLALVIAPSLGSSVVRKVAVGVNSRAQSSRVGAGSWSHAVGKSKSKIGLSFWRSLRKELEAKKRDLVTAGTQESSLLTAGARRDLLWQSVREVDDKFHKKFMCALDDGTTYAKDAMFLQGHAAYSKINIASPRECALMCAADSLADPSHKDLACKSFAYNRTAQECKFFNFAHQGRNTRVNDACCTTGPPCNLESMREEIQTHFQVELKRTIFKVPSQHVAPKAKLNVQQTHDAAPNIKQKNAPHVVPKVELKTAPQTKQVLAKVALGVPAKGSPNNGEKKASSSIALKHGASQWPYMQPMSPVMPQAQPFVPGYTVAMPPPYTVPMQPAYTVPMQPAYTAPMTVPMQPVYTAPMPPAYSAPVPPAYTVPTYTAPAYTPVSVMPGHAMPPRYPTAPMVHYPAVAKPKAAHSNHAGHGAVWWFVHMVFFLGIVLAAAMAVINKRGEVQRGASKRNSVTS